MGDPADAERRGGSRQARGKRVPAAEIDGQGYNLKQQLMDKEQK